MGAEKDQRIKKNALDALHQAARDREAGKPLPPLDPFAQALCETGDAPAVASHALRNKINRVCQLQER